MCKVAALKALLVHPHVADIECAVEAGGAGTNHNHSTFLHYEGRDRERRLTWVFEHHIDVVAFSGDVPDGFAELARFFEPFRVFRCANGRQLTPAIEVAAVQHAFRAKSHNEVSFVFIRDNADGVGARGVDKLDRIRAKAARCTPDQNVLTRLQIMRLVAEQHTISGRQGKSVTGAFFPREVLWSLHQLLRLNARELRE